MKQRPKRAGRPIAGARRERQAKSVPEPWRLTDHLVAFSGALLIGAVAVKIIRVAHLDLTTALILATESAPSTVVLGMLILFFPAIAPIFCLWYIGSATSLGRHLREGRAPLNPPPTWVLALVAGILSMLIVLTTPASAFGALGSWAFVAVVPAALILAVGSIRAWIARRRGEVRSSRKTLLGRFAISLVYLFAFAPLLINVFNDVVWLPPVQLKATQLPEQVGYVVAESGDTFVILLEGSRQVVRVAQDGVMDIQPCRFASLINSGQSIAGLLTNAPEPATPTCNPDRPTWRG